MYHIYKTQLILQALLEYGIFLITLEMRVDTTLMQMNQPITILQVVIKTDVMEELQYLMVVQQQDQLKFYIRRVPVIFHI